MVSGGEVDERSEVKSFNRNELWISLIVNKKFLNMMKLADAWTEITAD